MILNVSKSKDENVVSASTSIQSTVEFYFKLEYLNTTSDAWSLSIQVPQYSFFGQLKDIKLFDQIRSEALM